jgi:hypothetical protein
LHAQPVLQLRQGKDVDERPHQCSQSRSSTA